MATFLPGTEGPGFAHPGASRVTRASAAPIASRDAFLGPVRDTAARGARVAPSRRSPAPIRAGAMLLAALRAGTRRIELPPPRGSRSTLIDKQERHPRRLPGSVAGCYIEEVHALVKNGRLTLDEPTDLPEGTVVPLEIADNWDDLDDEERAQLHEAIREGFADAKNGQTIDAEEWAAELRSRL